MTTTYNVLKFLHVAAVTVWVGGIAALTIVNARLGRAGDRATLAALARETAFYGRTIIGPAVGVVLVAGIAMVALYHVPVTLWVAWGFAGILGFVLIGAVLSGRAGTELGRLVATASGDEGRVRVLQRRLRMLTAANLVLLLSVIWAMVSKPTL